MDVKQVNYKSSHAARDFTESLKETGFAVLQNHPISSDLIDASFGEWERFFASEEKARYTFDPEVQSGYFPFRTENAKDSPVKDLKEFFHYFRWSELPDGTREDTPRLFHKLEALAAELLGWVEEHTPPEVRARFKESLATMIEESANTLLRPIHYPALTGHEEAGAVRAAAHEDINLITLLPSATAPGLQVKDLEGQWHEVPCDRGMIAVNTGDMLQEASGHYYPSTTHRVMNPEGEEARLPRYSMPLFLHARPDVAISERYQTAQEFLNERLREIGLLKK